MGIYIEFFIVLDFLCNFIHSLWDKNGKYTLIRAHTKTQAKWEKNVENKNRMRSSHNCSQASDSNVKFNQNEIYHEILKQARDIT